MSHHARPPGVTLANWDLGGEPSAWAYLHAGELLPSVEIPIARRPAKLNSAELPGIAQFPVEPGVSLDRYVADGPVSGIVVVRAGTIVFERYPRMRPGDRHFMMSVTKAFTSAVVGILELRGELDLAQPAAPSTYGGSRPEPAPDFTRTSASRTPVTSPPHTARTCRPPVASGTSPSRTATCSRAASEARDCTCRPPAISSSASPGRPARMARPTCCAGSAAASSSRSDSISAWHTKRYADCMSDTTIRLDSTIRDKLRALAEEDHVTLGDLLSRLAEREQYQRDMRRANEVMARMQREDPAAWQEYLSELHAFEAGTSRDGLTPAASDWPEYNDAGSVTDALPGR